MHQMHSERNVHAKGVLQHSPTHHLTASTPTSRSHSISSSSTSSASAIHHPYSMHSTSTTTNSPSSHTNASSNHSLIGQTTIPSKYDFAHNASSALHSSQTSSSSSSVNLSGNLTANSNYMHSSNNLQTSLPYSNVKSESNTNFDYMNSCLQNGYFNSSHHSYGAITNPSATTSHPVSDLSSYHHIQAAKLMATSWMDNFVILFDKWFRWWN